MANRKQFLTPVAADTELGGLLLQAKRESVSEDELHEQRISFAFGNAPDSLKITKESVRHTSKSIRLCG